jgi:hypothetical protein
LIYLTPCSCSQVLSVRLPSRGARRKALMAIDEVLVATGHDLRHGHEKRCKRAWGGGARTRPTVAADAQQAQSRGWLGGCGHLKAQAQIKQRKSTRPWRFHFHKTTGGGPGTRFFGPPMPEPEESPSRSRGPIGGELRATESKCRRWGGTPAGEREASGSRYYQQTECVN